MSQIKLYIPGAELEYEFIQRVSRAYKRLKNERYNWVLPKISEIKCFFDKYELVPRSDKLFKIYKEKEYDRSFYKRAEKTLFPVIREANRQILKLQSYKLNWDFNIPKKYTLIPTRYGAGGSTDIDFGTVWLRVDRNGKTARDYPIHTVLHEIIHIGIEKNIVKKLGLNHYQREGLVDKIFLTTFGKDFPKYITRPKHRFNWPSNFEERLKVNFPSLVEEIFG